MRSGRSLLIATSPFASEDRLRSWWCLASTLALLSGSFAVGLLEVSWWWRLPFSVVTGLMLVRLFVIYHDFQHGAILKGSRIARMLMTVYGLFTLNPPSIWKRSHDHHHRNNAKLFGAEIGSYPVMTVDAYREAPLGRRLAYRAARHPLTIALGYFTIFFYGMCVRSLIRNPRLHYDSALSIVLHLLLVGFVAVDHGTDDLLLAVLLPAFLAAAIGAYLFYAQHNFPSARLRSGSDWDYVSAALESSSFIPMSGPMRYFTGNIGYHHVHHLNHRIPFYRLPEVMSAMPELQQPGTISLNPADVFRCLRLHLWDPHRRRLVGFAEGCANHPIDDGRSL